MKSIAAVAVFAVMTVLFCFGPAKADFAGWAEAQARAQIASQLLADNMHRMK